MRAFVNEKERFMPIKKKKKRKKDLCKWNGEHEFHFRNILTFLRF